LYRYAEAYLRRGAAREKLDDLEVGLYKQNSVGL
jgi:hypothetical protein